MGDSRTSRVDEPVGEDDDAGGAREDLVSFGEHPVGAVDDGLACVVVAHLLVANYVMGAPFYRLEQRLTFEGCPLDRGTMIRYAEDVGASLGDTVEAARQDAVGRKAWLFFGSDDDANAAVNLDSLFARCKLHRLDPEDYLADVIRVTPYWPRERYLELAPQLLGPDTRAARPKELESPVGHITVSPPLSADEQQASR